MPMDQAVARECEACSQTRYHETRFDPPCACPDLLALFELVRTIRIQIGQFGRYAPCLEPYRLRV